VAEPAVKVDGLPLDVTLEEIQQLFKVFGPRSLVSIAKGSDSASAVVVMDTPYDATLAADSIRLKTVRASKVSCVLHDIYDTGLIPSISSYGFFFHLAIYYILLCRLRGGMYQQRLSKIRGNDCNDIEVER